MNRQSLKTEVSIKFAILSETISLKPWELGCLEQILQIDNLQLAFVLITKSRLKIKKERFLKSIFKYGMIKMLYYFLGKFCVGRSFLKRKDLLGLLSKTPIIYCIPNKDQKSADTFEKADLETIKNAELDFIMAFSGFGNLSEDIFKLAKYGIWSLFIGIEKYDFRSLPAFWECYEGQNSIELSLVKLSPGSPSSLILKSGIIPIFTSSYFKTINEINVQAARWVKAGCFNGVIESNNCIERPISGEFLDGRRNPNSLEVIAFFSRWLGQKIMKYIKNLFFCDQWTIGYIDRPVNELLRNVKDYRINWLLFPQRKEFFADPFPIRRNDNLFIFFEKYNYKLRKGKIAFIEVGKRPKIKDVCLSARHSDHLSFPYVFEDKDEFFMVVEQWKTEEIILYRPKNFPSEWEKVATLIKNVKASDPIIFKFNELWWLFFTTVENNPDLDLFIYYSGKLSGPWIPHKKNPVKTDISSSRCAGRVFSHGDWLVRPAQNCSKGYGISIVLNKIIKLSPDDFEEEQVAGIEPNRKNRFNAGIHTFNPIENFVVVDGKRHIFALNNFFTKTIKNFWPHSNNQNDTKETD